MQTDATAPNNVGSCCARLHVAKRLTSFKLCATTPNNMQQGVQTDETCNIQLRWELLGNNVASVYLRIYSTCKEESVARE